MSGLPSTSRRPPSVVVEDASSSRVSSGTSYRPSRDSGEPPMNDDEAVIERTSAEPIPPPQPTLQLQPTPPPQPTLQLQPPPPQKPALSRHTKPSQGSVSRADEGATSRRLGLDQQNRGGARRSLVYSTKSSQTQDSQKLIAELRKEIQNLKQESRKQKAQGQVQAKGRPTKRTHASQRREQDQPAQSHKSRYEDLSETSSSQTESRSPTPPKISRDSLHGDEPLRSRPPPLWQKEFPSKEAPDQKNCSPWRAECRVEGA